MRALIRDLVEIFSKTLLIAEPIYEFGSRQIPGQERLTNLRPFFPGMKYIGCDLQSGSGVDMIADTTMIPVPGESVGTIMMLDTLEHVEQPREAIEEIFRCLRREDGILLLSTVFHFPYHAPPDYWRFSSDGVRSILKPFPTVIVVQSGARKDWPHTVVGVGFRNSSTVTDKFKKHISIWSEKWSRKEIA